jgi:hypothetical protein
MKEIRIAAICDLKRVRNRLKTEGDVLRNRGERRSKRRLSGARAIGIQTPSFGPLATECEIWVGYTGVFGSL